MKAIIPSSSWYEPPERVRSPQTQRPRSFAPYEQKLLRRQRGPDASWWINHSNGEVKPIILPWIRPSRKTINIETWFPEQILPIWSLGGLQVPFIAMMYPEELKLSDKTELG
ncbi:hypothetical protein GB937_005120 [Aspergillus fischeri]|nr:hypothetical protein GB937_005120 [Aspergillus fischeri]